ncbi:MAG: hypothetical protein ACYC1C_20985, partial [Chloroflexota bacterium]
ASTIRTLRRLAASPLLDVTICLLARGFFDRLIMPGFPAKRQQGAPHVYAASSGRADPLFFALPFFPR